MKAETVKALFPLMGSDVTGSRNEWIEGYCPFAPWAHKGGKDRNPSFGIKAETNKPSIFKCWSCGEGGSLMDLHMNLAIKVKSDPLPHPDINLGALLQICANEFDDIELDFDIPDYQEEKPRPSKPYPEKWLTSFKPLAQYDAGVLYWMSERHLPLALASELDVRFDPVRMRVCFPFRDPAGRLMGMQGRDITKKHKLRYLFYKYPGTDHVENMHAWLGEDRVDFDKPVVALEGPFDYASTFRVWPNTLASFSAGVSNAKLKRLAEASEIVTFYDNGAGGDAARARIKKLIKGIPIVDVIPEKEDSDPGAMSEEEVRYHLQEYLPL